MVRFILLVLSLTLFTEVGSSQSVSPHKGSEPERPKPVVNVQDQPGTPLKISTVETKWATPDQQILEIYVLLENVSDLKIRSYAWRIDNADGSQSKDGCFMYSIQPPAKILQPGDSDGRSTWRRFPVDGSTASIMLSVDFVEFDNDSTWGVNFCRSVEMGQLRKETDDQTQPIVTIRQSRSSPHLSVSSQNLDVSCGFAIKTILE